MIFTSVATTNCERDRELPGDSILSDPFIVTNHAVTIDTSLKSVWPWIAQLGQRRGGLYSYTWLENLIGCKMTNANCIHPQWQSIGKGDKIFLHPRAEPLTVALVEPDRYVVLQSSFAGQPTGEILQWTWSFNLTPAAGAPMGTRLQIRTRSRWSNWLLSPALRLILGPGHYLMEQKMLLGIKARAEKAHPVS